MNHFLNLRYAVRVRFGSASENIRAYDSAYRSLTATISELLMGRRPKCGQTTIAALNLAKLFLWQSVHKHSPAHPDEAILVAAVLVRTSLRPIYYTRPNAISASFCLDGIRLY